MNEEEAKGDLLKIAGVQRRDIFKKQQEHSNLEREGRLKERNGSAINN